MKTLFDLIKIGIVVAVFLLGISLLHHDDTAFVGFVILVIGAILFCYVFDCIDGQLTPLLIYGSLIPCTALFLTR